MLTASLIHIFKSLSSEFLSNFKWGVLLCLHYSLGAFAQAPAQWNKAKGKKALHKQQFIITTMID